MTDAPHDANPMANAADPVAAYQYALEAWGQVLAPLAAINRDKVNPKDRRFQGAEWDHPLFDLMRQGYSVMAEHLMSLADQMPVPEGGDKAKLHFAMRALVDALSPANSPFTNPVALRKAVETNGASLMSGVQNMMADLQRGQLTHTDPQAFRLGENIAVTPGQVVYQTPLFQLIQYAPATDSVFKTPLVIFPPWINRFTSSISAPKKASSNGVLTKG